jgi:hypothetical protein
MTRNWLVTFGLVVICTAGYLPNSVYGAVDPDAVGTVTLGATGVKANPNQNVITVSGTNSATAAAKADGWQLPPNANKPTIVFGVGQTTKYTILFTVVHQAAGAWTAESIPAANETYDVWAITTFQKVVRGQVTDTQVVGSEFKSQVVNKNLNTVTWIIGGTATYSDGYPARSGGNAFITGKGTWTLNQGFRRDPNSNFEFNTIPVDGGVVRGVLVGAGTPAGTWQSVALPVPAALTYNTYFTHKIDKDPQAEPPAPNDAVAHIINRVAKNR